MSREVPGTQEGEKEQMLREEKRQRMELNAVRFSTQNAENAGCFPRQFACGHRSNLILL